MLMTKTEREIQRKLRVLTHAAQISDVSKACRYFGVARASFYRWKSAYQRYGEAGLANRKTAPKNPANRTAPELVAKVLHLRQAYHLGPDPDRAVFGALSRHQNLRCRRVSHPQASWDQPPPARDLREGNDVAGQGRLDGTRSRAVLPSERYVRVS
jgi:Helix-turn-helix domain